jgi:hypothetical protein
MTAGSIIKKGHFISYRLTTRNVKNKFCGEHNIEGAECPNCKKRLLRFFSVYTDSIDPEIKDFAYGIIHLLYCWTCSISQEKFFYRVLDTKKIELLDYKKGTKQSDFPYPDYPEYFPIGEIIISKISQHDQKIIIDVNSKQVDEFDLDEDDEGLCVPRHQIGGVPYLVQGEFVDFSCPLCGLQMPFLASVADDCLDSKGFVGNSYVQVLYHYCKDCNVVGAIQQCD